MTERLYIFQQVLRKYRYVFLGLMTVLGVWFYFCLPEPLFEDPVSTVLVDKNGDLLGARIASDEQWRFPYKNDVPENFKKAIISFEDKRFYYHLGFDPIAFCRAMHLNIKQGKVVSGGSTLSMQVIRLSRKGKDRTVFEKFIEIIQATRLELKYSKDEILALYAAYAPFGGNVVGLKAAAWKYYGRSPEQLSWSETTALAVLPNAPSLVHPGKNRDVLRNKRNFLLDKLYAQGAIDSVTSQLAQYEPLPGKPYPLPSYARHLLEEVHQENLKGKRPDALVHSTLDIHTQSQVNGIIARHQYRLQENAINNAAALVIDASTGDVLAYVGNTPCKTGNHGCSVDIIKSRRSTGSILKPFLYASMLQDGQLLPNTLVADIPSYFSGYTPKNYHQTYDGATPAGEALYRSLNVPAVRMLSSYGHVKFHHTLNELGFTTIDRPANDYGLSLILGGAETTLWDLGATYSGMVRNLKHFRNNSGQYASDAFRPLNFEMAKSVSHVSDTDNEKLVDHTLLNASVVWHTFESMVEARRPGADGYWRHFSSDRKIAWKTGTSFGFRDAWAVGCTPDYVVAVWCGNADGEGRPGLVGLSAAAPLMFDIFDMLGRTQEWFDPPFDEMQEVAVCRESGHRALDICTAVDTQWIPKAGLKTAPCPYHKLVYLDATGQQRVHGDCASPFDMEQQSYFVLPPSQEWYYKSKHPDYKVLPDYRADCLMAMAQSNSQQSMDLVYPKLSTKIAIPVNLDETKSSTVFEVAHRRTNATIFWHMDESYIGKTKTFHELALNPDPGKHLLTLVDEQGEVLKRRFEIVD